MKHNLLVAFILCVRLIGWTSRSEACSCIMPPPPCEEFWRMDAVFVGEVLSVTVLPETPYTPSQLPTLNPLVRVVFNVKEAFRGALGSQVQVQTARGEQACGFSFRVGSTYLIYAYYEPGHPELQTSICTRTRAMDQAAEDLAYARSVATSSATGGRIFGTVRHSDIVAPGLPISEEPVAGIKALLSNRNQRWETKTGAAGEFEFVGLPTGTYEIRFEASAGFYLDSISRKVELRDVRGCGCANASVHSDGHVTGRVVTAEKKPIPGLTVELIYPEQLNERYLSPRYQVRTDGEGRFELTKVPPGRFLLGIHTLRDYRGPLPLPVIFHPGVMDPQQAASIELAAGKHLSLEDFVLPPGARFIPVTGTVTAQDGTPAKGAKVYLTDVSEPPRYIGLPAVTDDEGRFVLAAMEGYRFRIYSEMAKPLPEGNSMSEKVLVVASPNLAPFNLQLYRAR